MIDRRSCGQKGRPQERTEAKRKNPDPQDIENFINTQLESKHQEIRKMLR